MKLINLKKSSKKTKLTSKHKPLRRKSFIIFSAITIFALITATGISFVTGNKQDSSIGNSKASAQEPADINSDGKVDIFDLSILLSNWARTGVNTSDLNSDSLVNIFDLSMLLSKWGVVGGGTSTCQGTIHTPGGPDGMGGCWPGPQNTGYPRGLPGDSRTLVNLANYTGPTNIITAGTVIQNVKITQCITLGANANNVTFRNVLFQSSGCFWLVLNDNGATNLQIIDSEFDGLGGTSGDAAIAGYNYTLTRVNIHGTVDGLKLGSNVTIQDSYIHDLAIDPTVGVDGTHNDGMQSLGSDDVVIQHNTIIVKDGATSAIILSTGSADSIHRLNITNNLLAGGAYTVYGGYLAGTDNLSKVGSVSITNNRFSTVIFPKGGYYGPLTSVDAPAVTHTGNLWADGSKAGQSVD